MKIVGIFELNYSDDDIGVFVDFKMVWIIDGFGYGY